MRIALDVDGVLADYQGACVAWLRRHGFEHAKIEDITRWDIFDCLGARHLEGQFDREFLIRDEGCARLPTLPGARDFVYRLREAGHEIIAVTTSHPGIPEWDDQRRFWLAGLGIKTDDVIFTSRKDLIRADILVDDKPENAAAFAAAGGVGILLAKPWNAGNREMPGVIVAESLADAVRLIAAVAL